MAGIDILNIQPSVISRDLKGKYICIYGKEKVGKSTFGAYMPKSLFCNFEIGTNFLAGVKAIKVEKWSNFKLILRQLESEDAKAMYDTIVIDTISEAYNACEVFICAQNGVQKLGDVPYGAAYAACKKEFEATLRKITMLGYGLCCICHSETKNIPGPNDTTIEKIGPAMPTRAADVVNRLVDIIAYIDVYYDETGLAHRQFITRATPNVMAGSRLPYLASVIPFGETAKQTYDNLVNAIGDAIDKQQNIDGAVIVDTKEKEDIKELTYDELREEARVLWSKLVGLPGQEQNEQMAERIMQRVEKIFGRPIRLSEITENQLEPFNLVILEMKDLLNNKT